MRYSVIKIKIFNKIINLLRNSIDKISFESILNKSFKKGDEFRIIQVGAHDGVKHDFLSNFLIERDSKGILIEPINDYYNSLVQNFSKFPNLIKLKIALHCNLKESIIYKVDPVYEMNLPDWAPGSASFDKNNLIKQKINQDYIIEEKVSCSTFMDIYNKNYCFEKVDLIQIDVEGYDFEVIKMIDFVLNCIFCSFCPEVIFSVKINTATIDIETENNFFRTLINSFDDLNFISV